MTRSTQHGPMRAGFNVPAVPGMPVSEICTPALVIDLDSMDANIRCLGQYVSARGIRHRAHAKTHKSADIARRQMTLGGACGVCCQKVSEAKALIDNGVTDVLVSNQVVAPEKIAMLMELVPLARVQVCVDDAQNVADLAAAAVLAGVTLECLVELDVGAGRCGVQPGASAVRLAQQVVNSPGLSFAGLQSYDGAAQHVVDYEQRRQRIAAVVEQTRLTVDALAAVGISCDTVGGAGTGTFEFEGGSSVYNELQCGSYLFMDADYQRIKGQDQQPVTTFSNSLFVLTGVMSCAGDGYAVCDAGLKAHSVDSGLPVVFERPDLTFHKCSDEHGVILDPSSSLALNDKLWLVPGHCDPTCNLYDWYVGIRAGHVEQVWPVTARGMVW